jgi:RNA polymerase sigma factor (sigma-70 family)
MSELRKRARSAYLRTIAPKNANAIEATAEELEALLAALMTLPRFTREVFLAHRIDDMSYAEIAGRTGVSVGRIEREMSRAICTLAFGRRRRPLWWRW